MAKKSKAMCIDSNDGFSVEDFKQRANDKPLMTLFQRLISNDSKQNTVLTNAQILDILQKEFKININNMHNLEIEIYLNLMKKFLKDWPMWDEFEVTIRKLKLQRDSKTIMTKLEINHKNLKSYLNKMLVMAKPFMEKVTHDLPKTTAKMDSDIVLEILCTRQQLNQLFFQRPHPRRNKTIFNLESAPNKITWNSPSIQAILNWPGIQININMGSVVFKREIIHNLKHRLVNKKLNFGKEVPVKLNTCLQMKDSSKTTSSATLTDLCNVLDDMVHSVPFEDQTLVSLISKVMTHDFSTTENVIAVCSFRKMMSNYAYVRNLYAEVNAQQPRGSDLYDLQLEETMTPMFYYVVSKFEDGVKKNINKWLTIECLLCKFSTSQNICMSLREHFQAQHPKEPDWLCSMCDKEFCMEYLAENYWHHDCSAQPDGIN